MFAVPGFLFVQMRMCSLDMWMITVVLDCSIVAYVPFSFFVVHMYANFLCRLSYPFCLQITMPSDIAFLILPQFLAVASPVFSIEYLLFIHVYWQLR